MSGTRSAGDVLVFPGARYWPFVMALLVGCATTPQSTLEWLDAGRSDTIAGYEHYLEIWPNSIYASKARQRLTQLNLESHWQEACRNDDREAYETFLAMHPVTRHSETAFARLDSFLVREHRNEVQAAWDAAKASDTIAGYMDFVVHHPGSSRVAEARRRLEALGSSDVVEKALDGGREQIEAARRRNQGEILHPFVMLACRADDDTTRLYFKNENYRYVELVGSHERPLPPDCELPELRFVSPFKAVIISLPQDSGNTDAWRSDFEDEIVVFGRIYAQFLGMKPTQVSMYGIVEGGESNDGEYSGDLWMRLSASADAGSDRDRRLVAVEGWSIGSNPTVMNLVRRAEPYIHSYDSEIADIATRLLLSMGIAPAYQALHNTGQDAADALIRVYKNQKGSLKERARATLVAIGDVACQVVIAELNDSRWHKSEWISLLADIGDPRAVPVLVDLCLDWNNGSDAASALQSMGWSPQTVEEKTLFAVGTRNRKALLDDWVRARNVLRGRAEACNARQLYGIIHALLASGRSDAVLILKDIMKTHARKDLLELFINCGNADLSKAALACAKERGFTAMRSFSDDPAAAGRWGSF